MKLLEKLVTERDKIAQAREEQNLRAKKHQETAIRIMIEKEKAEEVTGLISKSPQARNTQEKLKSLEIKVEKDQHKGEVGAEV